MPTYSPNDKQQEAIESDSSLTVVIAGPGTGKTFTLTQRINYLITKQNLPPEKILAVTFTRKATQEMKERLDALLPQMKAKPTVSTLHKLGLTILTSSTKTPYSVIDSIQQKEIVHDLIKDLDIQLTTKEALQHISHIKSGESYKSESNDQQLLFNAYESYLTDNDLLDYDDMISKPIQLLENDTTLLHQWLGCYHHILVDEFQDLTAQQHTFIELLWNQAENNLLIIGDPDQSIYGFRGANPEGFLSFPQKYQTANIITLDTNYRSGQPILDISSSLLDKTPLTANNNIETLIQVTDTPNERLEAKYVVQLLQGLIGGVTRQNYDTDMVESSAEANYNFGDIAVLMRNRSQFKPFKQYLLRSGVPFQFVTETNFLTNENILTLLDQLKEYKANKDEKLTQVITSIASEIDTLKKEDLNLLLQEVEGINTGDSDADRTYLFQLLKILSFDDQIEIPIDRITFSTIHGSKGLEFPVVFVIGLEDGLLPHFWNEANIDKASISEEERLLYVAMTRAKERLYLSHAHYRRVHGTTEKRKPSRFLDKLSKESIIKHTFKEKRKDYQRKLF